ncbi:hypothetical protein [Weissella muntiaci]|nr:hypothetical protein [Weissella muntiaci]
MKKRDRLTKKIAARLTRDVELQLKRGEIHVELLNSAEELDAILADEK